MDCYTGILIQEIKQTLKFIGVSQKRFGEIYAMDQSECELDEDELNRASERIRKKLQRKTTKAVELERFLEFIRNISEYQKAVVPSAGIPFTRPNSMIADFASVDVELSRNDNPSVKEVAVSYAMSIGDAWDFQVIYLEQNDIGRRYLVLWEGDIGMNGGSGTWGTAMVEIQEARFGTYYVDKSDHHFDTGMRCVARAVNYSNGILTLIGYKYDTDDPNNKPSKVFKVGMKKNSDADWEVISEQYLGKRDTFIL